MGQVILICCNVIPELSPGYSFYDRSCISNSLPKSQTAHYYFAAKLLDIMEVQTINFIHIIVMWIIILV